MFGQFHIGDVVSSGTCILWFDGNERNAKYSCNGGCVVMFGDVIGCLESVVYFSIQDCHLEMRKKSIAMF